MAHQHLSIASALAANTPPLQSPLFYKVLPASIPPTFLSPSIFQTLSDSHVHTHTHICGQRRAIAIQIFLVPNGRNFHSVILPATEPRSESLHFKFSLSLRNLSAVPQRLPWMTVEFLPHLYYHPSEKRDPCQPPQAVNACVLARTSFCEPTL